MVKVCRPAAGALLALVLCGTVGCQLVHDLQPHRLKRLNHGVDGMPASDYYSFDADRGDRCEAYLASVADPVPAE